MSKQKVVVVNEFKEFSPEEMGACVMWYLQEQIKGHKEVIKESGLDRGSLEGLHHLVEVYNYVCDCSGHENEAYKYGDVI